MTTALMERLESTNEEELRPAEIRLKDLLRRRQDLGMKHYVRMLFRHFLVSNGLQSGTIAEIGGPQNSFRHQLPQYEFEFLSLFPVADDPSVKIADITNCPHIPSDRYDAVFSLSVFEHVKHPWAAGEEIERILKPGGIVFNAAPFSYFYHKAPEDYWRWTHASFEAIMPGIDTLYHEFYGRNRRRDNRGSKVNPVDGDGGAEFAVDELGGWRENWFCIHVGQKPSDGGERRRLVDRNQLIVNLVKRSIELGHAEEDAVAQVAKVVKDWVIERGRLMRSRDGYDISADDAKEIWSKRRPGGLKVTPDRYAQGAIVGLA